MGIFDINYGSPIRTETFMGSNIYYIDDFYKKPQLILKLLDTSPAKVHHPGRDLRFASKNGVYFDDKRHMSTFLEMEKVTSYLSKICKSTLDQDPRMLMTNKTRFYPNGVERDYGPYTMSTPTSLRFTGRQMRMRVSAVELGDWRVGVNRLDVVAGGRR